MGGADLQSLVVVFIVILIFAPQLFVELGDAFQELDDGLSELRSDWQDAKHTVLTDIEQQRTEAVKQESDPHLKWAVSLLFGIVAFVVFVQFTRVDQALGRVI